MQLMPMAGTNPVKIESGFVMHGSVSVTNGSDFVMGCTMAVLHLGDLEFCAMFSEFAQFI
jgi:hypothetical protein